MTGDPSTLADMTVLLLLLVFAVVTSRCWSCAATTKEADIFLRAAILLALGVALWFLKPGSDRQRGPFQTEELEVLRG